MKKLLLTLGAVASVAAPVAAVVACGTTDGGSLNTTAKSNKKTTDLNRIDLATLENKPVSVLDAAFGITSGAPTANLVSVGITYASGKLTFEAGSMDASTKYVITITPADAPVTPAVNPAAGTAKLSPVTFSPTATQAEFDALLTKIGYEGTMFFGQNGTSGDVTVLNGATATIFQGNKGDAASETHGSDDYAIVLTHAAERPTTAFTDFKSVWPIENKGEGVAHQADASHSSAMNFGDTAGTKLSAALQDKKAFAVIFIQTGSATTTAEYVELTTATKGSDTFPIHSQTTMDQDTIHKKA